MYKVSIRIIATLLLSVVTCVFLATATEAAKKRKTAKKKMVKQTVVETPEQKAERLERYRLCVVESKTIENEYYIKLSPEETAREGEGLDTDEFLYRVYLRTIKWDSHGCFAHKDGLAAARVNKSLKEYVIGGVNADFKVRLRKLIIFVEERDCGELRCKFGITSAFRDNYRQQIAEGYKASTCQSHHGGTCRTKGWGDGRAVDVVNVSLFDLEDERRWKSTDALWSHIDTFVVKTGLHRPLKVVDPMHIEYTRQAATQLNKHPVVKRPVKKSFQKKRQIIKKALPKKR